MRLRILTPYSANPKETLLRCERHKDTDPTVAIERAYQTLGNFDGVQTMAKIEYVGGFEQFGAYETWGFGWHVELFFLVPEKQSWKSGYVQLPWSSPIFARHVCLGCALDKAIENMYSRVVRYMPL